MFGIKNRVTQIYIRYFGFVAACVLLSACGGGGGGLRAADLAVCLQGAQAQPALRPVPGGGQDHLGDHVPGGRGDGLGLDDHGGQPA